MSQESLTQRLKNEARRLGFDLVGVSPSHPPPDLPALRRWLEAGYAGQMHYLGDRWEAYCDPRKVLEGVRSLLMLAIRYHPGGGAVSRAPGRVSCYAWASIDYHQRLGQRLKQLADFLRAEVPGARVRGVVDTAPLLERAFARQAGLGWIGKNTMLINKPRGSWFFLAALLTDVDLVADAPYISDHCGTCTACLEACPTGALVAPYQLDATRCISYLTVELQQAIPDPLRGQLGEWLFGCDVCQEVCPWNRRPGSQAQAECAPAEGLNPVDLPELLAIDERTFRRRFRHSALWRAKRRGLMRNAALLLAQDTSDRARRALRQALHDDQPLVREAAAWALAVQDQDQDQDQKRRPSEE